MNVGVRKVAVFLGCAFGVVSSACGPSGPAVCSTGEAWTQGDEESSLMRPGGDCIGCHARGEGPRFTVAGTVMNALNDDTDCYGVSGVTVEITGANGAVTSFLTNAAGNFYGNVFIATPFKARVVKGTKTREMGVVQTDTDCAHCHTATGANMAPGRILAP